MPKKRRISDGKRGSRGQESRDRILNEAIRMVSQEGLQALTIGRMAAELGMSKSGLFAHFGSKQKLQLATIERANGIFDKVVLMRSVERSPEGILRLWTLCDLWIRYLVNGVFPSGYFFTGAFMEYGRRHGSLAGSLRAVVKTWLTSLQSSAQHAQDMAELKPEPRAEDMAFELNALLVGAYWAHLAGSKRAYATARVVILDRMRTWATDKIPSRALEALAVGKSSSDRVCHTKANFRGHRIERQGERHTGLGAKCMNLLGRALRVTAIAFQFSFVTLNPQQRCFLVQ